MKLIKVIAVSLTMLFGAAQAQNLSIATGGTAVSYTHLTLPTILLV